MKRIEEKIRDAVEEGVMSKVAGGFKHGNDRVWWDGAKVCVSYRGNQVFEYENATGRWWLDDCGWATTMTKSRTAAAMEAVGLPYRFFVRKYDMWLRNEDTGREWKCGDGRIMKEDAESAGL